MKDGRLRHKKKPERKNRTREALSLQAEEAHNPTFRIPALRETEFDDKLLKDAQQEYMYEPGLHLLSRNCRAHYVKGFSKTSLH